MSKFIYVFLNRETLKPKQLLVGSSNTRMAYQMEHYARQGFKKLSSSDKKEFGLYKVKIEEPEELL